MSSLSADLSEHTTKLCSSMKRQPSHRESPSSDRRQRIYNESRYHVSSPRDSPERYSKLIVTRNSCPEMPWRMAILDHGIIWITHQALGWYMLAQHMESTQDVALVFGSRKGCTAPHRRTLFMPNRGREATVASMGCIPASLDTMTMKTKGQNSAIYASIIRGRVVQQGDSLQQIASWRILIPPRL